MFIINLKKTAVINYENCLALKRVGSVIVAMILKTQPDCPYVITLAEYSNDTYAQKVFESIIEQMKFNPKYITMPEEKEE